MSDAVLIFVEKAAFAWVLGYGFGAVCRVIKQFIEKAMT